MDELDKVAVERAGKIHELCDPAATDFLFGQNRVGGHRKTDFTRGADRFAGGFERSLDVGERIVRAAVGRVDGDHQPEHARLF